MKTAGFVLAIFMAAVVGLIAMRMAVVRPCIATQRQLVATYPNMALMALGSQYTAIALIPAMVEQDVCVGRAPK